MTPEMIEPAEACSEGMFFKVRCENLNKGENTNVCMVQ